MAMDKDVLKDLIMAKMTDVRNTAAFQEGDALEKGELIWGAVADAFIEHITNAAQITFRDTDEGIQRSTAVGDDTDAPSSDVILDAGQIS